MSIAYIKLARVIKRHIFLLVAVVAFLLTPWLVSADTVYQQLTDSTSFLNGNSGVVNVGVLVATFIPDRDYTVTASSTLFGVFSNTSGTDLQVNIYVTTVNNTSAVSWTNSNNYQSGTTELLSNGADLFLILPKVSGNISTYIASTTYYVYTLGDVSHNYKIITSTENNFFGNITTDSQTSVPILAGLVGFTDVGISTSSQRAYCNSSFATTTGFLDSVGSSISNGMCNVGVFLFVPNTNTLSQFSNLASAVQAKFPFAYFFSAKDTLDGLVASSTSNAPTYTYNLHDLGIGSTTAVGNILPNFTVFSSSTVTAYFPAGLFDVLKSLAGLAIILTLFADIFFTVKGLPRNS